MLRKGLIVTNSYLKNDKLIKQVEIISKELEKRNIAYEIAKSNEVKLFVGSQGMLKNEYNADFAIFYDKDARLCRMLELCGIRAFNKSETMRISDDKMSTHIELSQIGIKMPTTISSPLVYSNENRDDEEFLDKTIKIIGFPMIIKENYGSLGMQVYLVNDKNEMLETYRKLKHTPHLYQQFISSSFGKDIRVILIDKKVVVAAERVSNGDFRSNLAQSGTMRPFELPSCLVEASESVAKFLDADYCSVDFLFGANGEWYLCEVNSNAFFIGISAATNVDIAGKYVDYIVSEVYK